MILRSIRAEGWRCFIDPIEVGEFQDGLNVVHAPNASGKSSLLEAFVRGLFDSHRVTGMDAEAMRPWGRDLAPTVTLIFEHAKTSYRLTKRFLDQPYSRLERLEGGRYVRLAEGDPADQQVRTMLEGNPPGRGMAKSIHWGLGQVLYVPQGQLALSGVAGDLAARIRQSLGSQLAGPEATRIEKKIQDLYLRYFTEKGRIRSGKEAPAFVQMEAERDKLRNRRKELQEELRAFEEASRDVEDLAARRKQARRDAEALEKILREVRARVRQYEELLRLEETCEARVIAAEGRHRAVADLIEAIRRTREDLERTRAKIDELRERISIQDREIEALRQQRDQFMVRIEEIRKEREKVEEAWREAELAQRFQQAWEGLEKARNLLELIEEVQKQLDEKRRRLAEVEAPDKAHLARIRKAVKERDLSRVQLDAALITLEIMPEMPASLHIVAAEHPGRRDLSPGEHVQIRGAPEVTVEIEGVARIWAHGPAGPVEELRESFREAERKVEKLTAGFGFASIEALEELHEKWAELKSRVEKSQTRLETLLGDRTVEDIQQEKTRTQNILEELFLQRPSWRDSPPDVQALRAQAKQVQASVDSRLEEAQKNFEVARSALEEARVRQKGLRTELEAAEREKKRLGSRLAELERDGRTDRDRAEEAERIALEWQAAQASLKDVKEKLAAFAGDPRLEVEKLEGQQQALEQAATESLEKQKKAEGRLAEIAARGSYTSLAEVEEHLADLDREIEAERLRVEAVRLLHQTVTDCRSEIMAAVSSPVEDAATRIVKRIAGPSVGGLKLGGSFEVASLRPAGLEEAVSTDELSGGEKEQVYLAVRLALANLLAKNGRELVVFDDVLTATDAGRFARILTVLEEFAQRLQILIFTCHPERYRGLAHARFFDLVELAS